LVVTVADLECAILRIVGRIIGTTDAIKDVLAIIGSVGILGITCLHAKGAAAHEVVPFNNLGVLAIASEVVREQYATHGITTLKEQG
jgi:hypothetical protein